MRGKWITVPMWLFETFAIILGLSEYPYYGSPLKLYPHPFPPKNLAVTLREADTGIDIATVSDVFHSCPMGSFFDIFAGACADK